MAKNNRYMKGEELLKKAMPKEEDEEEDTIEMSKEDLVDEHKKLIKVLRSGNKTEQMKEAADQEKELKKYL